MRSISKTLSCIGILGLLLTQASAAGLDEEFDKKRKAFERVAVSGTPAERERALQELVGTEEPLAVTVLSGEFARAATKLRKAEEELVRVRYQLDRKRTLLLTLQMRAERDESLNESVAAQQQRIRDLEAQVERHQGVVEEMDPWIESMGAGASGLFASLGSKAKSARKDLWETAEEAAELNQRLAAVEMLGFVGAEGTAVDMQKLIADLGKERSSERRKLPKLLIDVRKMEARMQKEQEQNDGRGSAATMQQYERAKAEAVSVQRAVVELARVMEACVDAGGRALKREEGPLLERALSALLKAQKKAKGDARLRTLEMIASSGSAEVVAALRSLLEKEKEPVVKGKVIAALAATGDTELSPWLLETALADESWQVRSRAIAALATLRVRDAIPALIERLSNAEGRELTDCGEALTSLTGMNFHGNKELWRRWWADNSDGFVVPELKEESDASAAAEETVGVTFFGIRTDSRRVMFVLDLSGSMNFAMVPRDNPDDDPQKPYDMPRKDEFSRLDVAKTELMRALGGLDEGSIFNIVMYASDVWTWKDDLVEMEEDTRPKISEFLDSLEAVGATNLYSALEVALDISGAQASEKWQEPEIDTIFVLSDGRPSVGLSTDPDEILALVKERNEAAGITIHTIGLSGAQDAYLMRSLAEQNGGTYAAR
ncbi:MAG: HEAT repeat domain-containing protein [Planctomycetes bacterium]|nr:HEAT repeat domain-containing protein [Planctomycetota bacterium]